MRLSPAESNPAQRKGHGRTQEKEEGEQDEEGTEKMEEHLLLRGQHGTRG